MMYSGDELYDDDVTSGPTREHVEDYCDYCERDGHTFRSCPKRDDDPDDDYDEDVRYKGTEYPEFDS